MSHGASVRVRTVRLRSLGAAFAIMGLGLCSSGWCSGGVSSGPLPRWMVPGARRYVLKWLEGRKDIRLANDGDSNLYRSRPEYFLRRPMPTHPYYVTGDFNKDGSYDIAFGFVYKDGGDSTKTGGIVIFNGRLKKGQVTEYNVATTIDSLPMQEVMLERADRGWLIETWDDLTGFRYYAKGGTYVRKLLPGDDKL